MNKNIIKKSIIGIISFVLIIMLLITGNNAFTVKDGTKLTELARASRTNEWYDFKPSEALGKRIDGTGGNLDFFLQGNYCLDPHTYATKQGFKYEMVNVFDINNNTNTVRIYSVEDKNNYKEYSLSDPRVKPVLALAYLTQKADEVWKPNTIDQYKWSIYQIFNSRTWVNQLRAVGLSKYFYTNVGNYSYEHDTGVKGLNTITEALKAAEKMSNEGAIKTASMSVEMTEKEKNNVSLIVDGNKTYIGPYKLNLNNGCKVGSITINGSITAAGISTDLKTTKAVNTVVDNKEFYIVVNQKIDEIKKIQVKAQESVSSLRSRMVLLGNSPTQNFMVWKSEKTTVIPEVELEAPKFGKLQIVKVDEFKSSSINLKDIGFKVYSVNNKNWLKIQDNKVTFVDFDKADELKTNKDGKTDVIDYLPLGRYMIYETYLPDNLKEYYLLPEITLKNKDGVEFTTTAKLVKINGNDYINIASGQQVTITATNYREYTSISGLVWEDVKQGKNDQVNNNQLDNNDYRINGVEVKLMDRTTGKAVQTTKTANGGKYRFDKVQISKLADYYVEFTYDGVTYQSVTTPANVNDDGLTSKAKEVAQTRKALNDKFTELTGEGQNLSGVTLSYDKQKDGESSKVTSKNISDRANALDLTNKVVNLTKQGDFVITSVTNNNYLKSRYDELSANTIGDLTAEISNVNLGLVKREQPDLAVSKDVNSAEISVNGKSYVYKYGVKDLATAGDLVQNVETALGVRFSNKNPLNGKYSYSLPIYKTDAVYENEDKSKELKASITYKIGLINNSNSLYTKVNSLNEMYSKDLKIEKVYTLDAQGNENVLYNSLEGTELGNFAQTKMDNLNIQVAPNSVKYVYIKFQLPKDDIYNVVEKTLYADKEFENHVEIASYTVYGDEYRNTYAGFDTNSIPNNYNVNNTDATDENDSDKAPGIKIVDAGVRTIKGIVFEDKDRDANDNEKLGNGQYDNDENKVKNVKVSLVDSNNTVVATTTSNENGEYEFSGFVPGDYTVQFTWGEGVNTTINDKQVLVGEYKSTIWTEANIAEKQDARWFTHTDVRYSDALDNYETRKEIDKSTANLKEMLNKNSNELLMTSKTPSIEIGVELKDYEEALVNNKLVYKFDVENVDFGIIERPTQSIDIVKDVDSIKIYVGNNILVDGKMNEQGKLVGTVKGVQGSLAEGFINIQIDNNLLTDAEAEVTYKVKVKNTSELDYEGEDYYFYGRKNGDKVITLTAESINDYLRGLSPTVNQNNEWEVVPNVELQDRVSTSVIDLLVAKSIANQNENANNTLYNVNTNTANLIANWVLDFNLKNNIKSVEQLKAIEGSDYLRDILSIKCNNAITSTNKDKTFEIKPGEEKVYEFYSNRKLASTDDLVFENDVELGNVIRNSESGSSVSIAKSNLYNKAQRITITPPTGENKDYTSIIVISVSAVAILGIGIVVIKKVILK